MILIEWKYMMPLKCRLIGAPIINKYAKISNMGLQLIFCTTSNIKHKREAYLTARPKNMGGCASMCLISGSLFVWLLTHECTVI